MKFCKKKNYSMSKNIEMCIKRYNMSMTCAGHFMRDCPDLNDYKFYLAFENSLCSEYITEKLWWNAYSKVGRAQRAIKDIDQTPPPRGLCPLLWEA